MYPQHVTHWIADREVASSSGATFEKRCPIDDRVVAHRRARLGGGRRERAGRSGRRGATRGAACRRRSAARCSAARPRLLRERDNEFAEIIGRKQASR